MTKSIRSLRTDFNAQVVNRLELEARAGDETVPVTAVIRRPFECADREWICAASITGLIHRKADFHGVTATEAELAAQSFVERELEAFLQGGGQLRTAAKLPVDDLQSLFERID